VAGQSPSEEEEEEELDDEEIQFRNAELQQQAFIKDFARSHMGRDTFSIIYEYSNTRIAPTSMVR